MKDVQNSEDTRGIAIDRVGVCDVRYPITVLDRNQDKQSTVATIDLSVDLPHHFKGTHMSRFIEILNRRHGEITMKNIPEILDELKERLEAESSQIEITFPYFLNKKDILYQLYIFCPKHQFFPYLYLLIYIIFH